VAEVDDSARRRAEYSSDASLYRVPPLAVVFPRDAAEVEAVLTVCRELDVPLTSRGAGTSIAGNAVGPGIVADHSRHLDRIVELDPEAATATVEPGIVLDTLQAAAKPHGLRFGPDPSTHSRCTLGGMIGNNACGSRALAYGRTADNVLELDLVAGNGERLRAVRDPDPGASPTLDQLRVVVAASLATIRTRFGRFGRQVSGYSLEHLLPERGFDTARALVGTEGTLGIVTRAKVRLVRAPKATALAVLGYPDLATAADATAVLLPFGPVALEGMDARMLDAVRHLGRTLPHLPGGGALLFAELPGETAEEAGSAARRVPEAAGALDSLVVTDAKQAAALWRIREDAAGLSGRTPAGAPAWSGWEDAAVPPEKLGAYLRDFDRLLDEHGLDGIPYGHLGDGCVHVRIDYPLERPGGAGAYRAFVEAAARLVAGHGGSMSGEHGDGRARSELLPLMYPPEALTAMAAVKHAFDPASVLNPGVVVDPLPFDAALRRPAAAPVRDGLGFTYPEDRDDLTTAVHRCTGVGKCVAATPAGVMCPSYVATRDEKDSTRGRARVLQEAVNGTLVGGLTAPEVHESLELCLSCKGCASDCPTGIDMATYKAEVLYRTYKGRPRPATHYSLGWLPRVARLAALAPGVVNRLLTIGPVAARAKRLGGIDQARALPAFATRTFRSWFRGREAPAGEHGTPVVLWVDTFTNHFTPEVGRAAVTVLERAGYEVRIPDEVLCCGLTWISTGQLDTARRMAARSVAALAPLVADGTRVVGLEPSCTAVLREDAARLLGPGLASAVAKATVTLAELLERDEAELPDLHGVEGVAQPHCHQHAVLGWEADRDLLARAGAQVEAVGGCCGLAGNFGFEAGHAGVSAAIAETALLPAVRRAGPDAVVLADGFSCRTQLEQLGGRRALHLAELLADGPP
jgi:FAD/FMN-containing dehydrogenase/Fe-S oxidoreductase